MADTGFTRPTLPELIEQVRADLLARLGLDELLRRVDGEVQARVQAAALHSLYGFIDFLARQVLPDTADTDWLDRHADLWGVQRKAAATATGTVTVSASTGVTIPAGTVLQRAGLGDYTAATNATAAAGVATVTVTAAAPGQAYNLPAGARLTLVSPVAGAQSTAVVVDVSGGADIESDDALRARLVTRIQTPPHGGNRSDYEVWALEIPGVTRTWVTPHHMGAGTVGLSFVCDGRADIIPTPGEVANVAAHIEALRPVTAAVTVYAPAPAPLPLTIRLTPDAMATRAAVQAELRDFLAREAVPGGTVYLSRLREAISAAAGEFRHELEAPTADVVSPPGHIATLGAITWL
ncbi:putative phage protein gp47/JayE [Azospirillum baldaniorum]|uniref:baseplate J/gp47 family protein n=1 Tax=Azospirillum baldaniorum TaxID=1064539 RepID=UPI0011A233F1|nr:baseplate J/gp47 family protein [Azospirillum baldaniorum]TWA69742.1 putative phage protein gp47/JayE [Azospirillum baldaniorum]